MKNILSLIPPIRAWNGAQTKELVQHPKSFGLGCLPDRLTPDATTTMVCGFCSTGCGLRIHLKGGEAINLSAETSYPVNLGMACPKGWEALTPLAAPDRAIAPLLRDRTTGETTVLDWIKAAETFCERMKAIQAEHGPESVAFLSTGQICSEEMALLGAFAKFGMGVIHGDGNTRQCMATAVAAYKESFGFDAPPFSYDDLEESDVLVFVGANPCIAHPIMWQRVMQNKRNPEIIVIDPRLTETAGAATRHYAIAPKSDLTLLYALANELIQQGWVDEAFVREHTAGFEEFREFLSGEDKETGGLGDTVTRGLGEGVNEDVPNLSDPPVTPSPCHPLTLSLKEAAKATGISEERLRELVALIKPGKRVSFWWTMGVNQGHEATRTAQAIINLALLGGHLGKPGSGANSITGQCNAMGSRLFSNTTNLMGGHDFTDPIHRAKVAEALDIPVLCIPSVPSLAYDQILEGVEQGRIKALWIIATNPAHSWIEQGRFHKLREKLDFLIVQDMYHSTETARTADLLLPAAGWGEKEGTFINSERRIGLVKRVAKAPGLALADFFIFRLLAEAWGCGELFKDWTSPEAAFQKMKALSKGQPCDISGITGYEMLDACGGIQWPCPARTSIEEAAKARRLFGDGRFFTPDERAKFCFSDPTPPPEPTDFDFPLILLTGRGTSAQWHTQTRTAKSAILRKLYPAELYLEINAKDAARLKIGDRDWVEVTSRRGSLKARAVLTPAVMPGQVFLPMHEPAVNLLTLNTVDPKSRQPNYKHCAVRVSRFQVSGSKVSRS